MEDGTYNKFVLTSSWLNKVDTHRVLIGRRILNAPVMHMKTLHHTAKQSPTTVLNTSGM